MKNKSDILMYVAAIVGGVLGPSLFVSNIGDENLNSAIGLIVMVVCPIYILGHSINSYLDASEKRRAERLAEKEKDTKSKSDRNLKRRKISIMLLEMN